MIETWPRIIIATRNGGKVNSHNWVKSIAIVRQVSFQWFGGDIVEMLKFSTCHADQAKQRMDI